MWLTVSLQEVIWSYFVLNTSNRERQWLHQQHLGVSGKDDALNVEEGTVIAKLETLSVLSCVWYVWRPLRKHGCVGANPFVGHSHVSISSSWGKKTSCFQQVEHTPTNSLFIRLYGGLCGPHTSSLSSLCRTEHQHQQQMYSHFHIGVPRGPTEEVELGKIKHIKWKTF